MAEPNPYDPPQTDAGHPPPADVPRRGAPCPSCGSSNTTMNVALRQRPSIIYVLLFGWAFLLVRGAFSKRNATCHACDEVFRYKSVGSWIALVILILLISLIALSALE